ncbi:MAG: hypothetical protein QW728_06150, partial [Thermoplasmata archaeon]
MLQEKAAESSQGTIVQSQASLFEISSQKEVGNLSSAETAKSSTELGGIETASEIPQKEEGANATDSAVKEQTSSGTTTAESLSLSSSSPAEDGLSGDSLDVDDFLSKWSARLSIPLSLSETTSTLGHTPLETLSKYDSIMAQPVVEFDISAEYLRCTEEEISRKMEELRRAAEQAITDKIAPVPQWVREGLFYFDDLLASIDKVLPPPDVTLSQEDIFSKINTNKADLQFLIDNTRTVSQVQSLLKAASMHNEHAKAELGAGKLDNAFLHVLQSRAAIDAIAGFLKEYTSSLLDLAKEMRYNISQELLSFKDGEIHLNEGRLRNAITVFAQLQKSLLDKISRGASDYIYLHKSEMSAMGYSEVPVSPEENTVEELELLLHSISKPGESNIEEDIGKALYIIYSQIPLLWKDSLFVDYIRLLLLLKHLRNTVGNEAMIVQKMLEIADKLVSGFESENLSFMFAKKIFSQVSLDISLKKWGVEQQMRIAQGALQAEKLFTKYNDVKMFLDATEHTIRSIGAKGINVSKADDLLKKSRDFLRSNNFEDAVKTALSASQLARTYEDMAPQCRKALEEARNNYKLAVSIGGDYTEAKSLLEKAAKAYLESNYEVALSSAIKASQIISTLQTKYLNEIIRAARAKLIELQKEGVDVLDAVESLDSAEKKLTDGRVQETIELIKKATTIAKRRKKLNISTREMIDKLEKGIEEYRRLGTVTDEIALAHTKAEEFYKKEAFKIAYDLASKAFERLKKNSLTAVSDSISQAHKLIDIAKIFGCDVSEGIKHLTLAEEFFGKEELVSARREAIEAYDKTDERIQSMAEKIISDLREMMDNVSQLEGINLSEERLLLEEVKASFKYAKYERCSEQIDKLRNSLTAKAKEKVDAVIIPAREKIALAKKYESPVDIAETLLAKAEDAYSKKDYLRAIENAKDALQIAQDATRGQAKMTMLVAHSALKEGEIDGIPLPKSRELINQMQVEFEKGNYIDVVDIAVRCKEGVPLEKASLVEEPLNTMKAAFEKAARLKIKMPFPPDELKILEDEY